MSKGQAATKQKTTASRPGTARASAAPKKATETKKAAGSKVEPKVAAKIADKIEPKSAAKVAPKGPSKIAPKIDSKAEQKTEPKTELKKVSEEKGMAPKVAVATKAKAKEQEAAPADKDTPEAPDNPLLDLSDAGVKKMIKLAKKRGYVTHDQLNAVLPSEEVSSDRIEDVYAMLNEMGINVVDNEENVDEEEKEEQADDDDDGQQRDLRRCRHPGVVEPAVDPAGHQQVGARGVQHARRQHRVGGDVDQVVNASARHFCHDSGPGWPGYCPEFTIRQAVYGIL